MRFRRWLREKFRPTSVPFGPRGRTQFPDMATATATPAATTRPAGEVIRGADLFASGVYRGKPYAVADLDEIAANFRKLKDQLDPPAVLGHEEEQEFLGAVLGEQAAKGDDGDDDSESERTDQPAAGWVDAVWVKKYTDATTGRQEGILQGNIVGVPPKIADMIRKKRYRKISAEVYDDYLDDFGRPHGKALRRVAYLGAEVPQVKRLADIPAPTPFSERAAPSTRTRTFSLRPAGGRPTTRGTHLCFAEPIGATTAGRTAHDRRSLIHTIRTALPGVQATTLDPMADDQLADLAKNLPDPTPKPQPQPIVPPATPTTPPGVQTMADVATMSKEELITAITAAGEPADGLTEMSDDDLRELATELGVGGAPEGDGSGMVMNMADPASMSREELMAELVAMGQDPTALEAMDDEALRAMLAQSATPPATPPAGGATAMGDMNLNKYAEKKTRETLVRLMRHEAKAKRQRITMHCERLVQEGKVLPAMIPVVRFALMKADDTKAVHKFSENGVNKTGTKFSELLAVTAGLPKLGLFSEKIGGGTATGVKADERREVRAVQKFAEVYAETLRKGGETPESYVRKFTEARKKRPELTAAEFGIPADFYG